jgi:hypothetical protein
MNLVQQKCWICNLDEYLWFQGLTIEDRELVVEMSNRGRRQEVNHDGGHDEEQ